MNTLKTVYNKLFKEETQLAKHEVELASVDELNKFYNDIYNSIQDARIGLDKASKEYRTLEVKFQKNFESAMKGARESLQQFENISKQLGIDPNQIKEYKTLSLRVNVAPKDYGQMQESYRNK
jgi:DNA repair ATPase RecN